MVRLLLDNRADVHARNIFGVTALMIAASSDDVQTVKMLLDKGADPSLVPHCRPLDADGSPVEVVFGGGLNALSWASLKGNREVARLLIDAGADVNGQAMLGAPLTAAAQRNRADVARLLLDRGADVDAVAPAGTWTPLMWAAGNEYGDTEVVKLLIEYGATVSALHGESWGPQMSVPHSPLMIAKRRGETAIVELLRKAGAEELHDPWAIKARTPPRRAVPGDHRSLQARLESIQAAVPLLERTAVESFKEFSSHGQNCISCHNQLLPLMAVSLAKRKGIDHDQQALEQMVSMERKMPKIQQAINSETTFHPSPSTFFGYLLWGMASESAQPDFSTDVAVHCVAAYQAEDGGWLQPFSRPPITDSEISSTALGVRALTLYPLPGRKAEMEERVARAADWLRKSTPRITEDHVLKLLGLYWAGEQRERLAPLVSELSDLQRADGGWAQLPDLQSDAYATGQALYALQEAGGKGGADDVLRKGFAYLVRTQCTDGSWLVRRRAYPFQPTMDARFPHGRDAWISTAATSWAVMALGTGLETQQPAESLSNDVCADSTGTAIRSANLPEASTIAVDYDRHIRPILESSCLDCHSSDDPAGQYALDTRASLIKGGLSGPPVVLPGNSADSLLVHHVAGLIEDIEMPPLRAATNISH